MQDKKKKPGLFSCVKEAGPLARKAGFLARSIFALYTKFDFLASLSDRSDRLALKINKNSM